MGRRREAAMRNQTVKDSRGKADSQTDSERQTGKQTVKDSRGKEGKWEEFRAQAKGLTDK